MSRKVPEEIGGVLKIEVSAIHDKIEKCYSKEKYEEFQAAVEKIVKRYLKSHIVWAINHHHNWGINSRQRQYYKTPRLSLACVIV